MSSGAPGPPILVGTQPGSREFEKTSGQRRARRRAEPALAVLLTDRHTFFAKHLQARAPPDLNQFTSLTSGVGPTHINMWEEKMALIYKIEPNEGREGSG